jgi:hypothetical protein
MKNILSGDCPFLLTSMWSMEVLPRIEKSVLVVLQVFVLYNDGSVFALCPIVPFSRLGPPHSFFRYLIC